MGLVMLWVVRFILVLHGLGCVVLVRHWCVVRDLGLSLLDDGVEPVVVVSSILHRAHTAVRLYQRVLTLHHVTLPRLPLALAVPRVVVGHGVVERVLGGSLQQKTDL